MSFCYTPGGVGRSRNPEFSGLYEIVTDAEVVKGNTPGPYRTVLYAKKHCVPVASVVSGVDGLYRFTHLNGDSRLYFVVAFDQDGGGSNMGASDLVDLSFMATPVF
jgi:hypothetical protein